MATAGMPEDRAATSRFGGLTDSDNENSDGHGSTCSDGRWTDGTKFSDLVDDGDDDDDDGAAAASAADDDDDVEDAGAAGHSDSAAGINRRLGE